MAKPKKWICAKKAKAFRTKNLGQSGTFLSANASRVLTKLKQIFVEASILNHFNLECHIWIETDALGYTIGGILSQLTLDDLSRWNLVAFFSRKIIPAKTRYETHDGELLAIIEVFKTWRQYLKGCKQEVHMHTNHNKLQHFINTKSLSSRQVRWAEKLSKYHFWIDYRQGKVNKVVDTLSQYPQQSAEEEKTLQAENTKILHWLQSSLS